MSVREPPQRPREIVRYLGPGLILAGSIVGSGELIATTRTGAEAGFSFLWLIILGCTLKVFTQVEIAKHCIVQSQTTVTALRSIPGVGNFIAIFWFITFLTGLAQLGGIVGGVGQALHLTFPVLSDVRWAAVVTLITILMLTAGGFGFIEAFCTTLVASFTIITVGNVIALQTHGEWAIQWSELWAGLSFGMPQAVDGLNPLATALATFGIIGVGGAELVAYPYWCLEKGYGAWTGKKDGSEAWRRRATGWLRVLRWDAWISMVVYTISTCAFYLLGAAVLHRSGLIPEKSEMVATLSEMYQPVFGQAAGFIFLIGAVAVLFSTFFVSNATKARLMTDALFVFRILPASMEERRKMLIKVFGVVFPIICLIVYVVFPRPVLLVLLSGVMQALLIPMLAFAALFFRYRRQEAGLPVSRAHDAMLWLSFAAFLLVGGYLLWTKGGDLWNVLAGLFTGGPG